MTREMFNQILIGVVIVGFIIGYRWYRLKKENEKLKAENMLLKLGSQLPKPK